MGRIDFFHLVWLIGFSPDSCKLAGLVLFNDVALDPRFRFAGAAAVLVQALDRRFVLPVLVSCWCRRWLWIGVSFCQG